MNEIMTLDNELGISIIFYETPIALTNYLKENNIDMNLNELFNRIASPDVKTLFESHILENSPEAIKKEEYERCINLIRPQLIQAYHRLFEKYQIDLLAYPSLPCLPIKFDEIKNIGILSVMVRNNSPTSNAGIPSLTIPIAISANGLPIGLHLDALFNRDQYLLKCGTLIHKLF
jgi:Asp-tRNA(Asn)/Glu-tRNA(Gln) amidotransferase A subunit family amidase